MLMCGIGPRFCAILSPLDEPVVTRIGHEHLRLVAAYIHPRPWGPRVAARIR